jgi:photosystem II stability/assembly factor-like uncharacterized protein
MKKLSIFVLVVLLLAPMSISATESDETDEAMELPFNDGTGTWSAINSGLTNTHVTSLAIDPSNTGTIYAGTGVGVFKSTDDGGNWSAINSGLTYEVHALAIDPTNAKIIYAASNYEGIYKSTNGGKSWIQFTGGLVCTAGYGNIAIDPSNTDILYTGGNCRVDKSTNGGGNWINGGLTGNDVRAIAIDSANTSIIYAGTYGNGVYKCTDAGETWSDINSGLTNTYVITLAINPTNTSNIYAGTDGGVFKSTDGGGHWSAINSGLTNTHITALAIDPSDPSFIYAGTNGGVFESIDGGASWNAINSGLTNTHVTSLAIDPSNPDILYAGTYGGGVFKFSSAEGPPSLHVSKLGTGVGSVTSTPSGIDCGYTCTALYTEGTSVTLTATPSSGSIFTGWSGGGCSGTDLCTITLNSNTTVEASFALSGNCVYTISPVNKTFKANGGSVSIKVSATGQTNCPAPPVNANVQWISVSGIPSWKANKETVKLTVQQNSSSQSRTGVVSIGGEDLTIQEDGAICKLTALTPSSGKYPNTGGSGSFDITVSPHDCGWNVATTFDWIHLDTTTGTGNGTATFHMDANGTGKNKAGKINVSLDQNATKKKTFTVNENK